MEILNELLSDNIGYINALRNAQSPILETAALANFVTPDVNLKKSRSPYLLIGVGVIGLIIIRYVIIENNKKKNQQQN